MNSSEKQSSEKKFDQQKHPELQEGEVWITNSDMDERKIGWKTARVGNIAYSSDGQVISGLVPIFAQKKEVDKKRE